MGVNRSGFDKALKKFYDQADDHVAATPLASAAATGVLTFTGVAVADETVTIDNRVYTWKASPSAVGEVKIGANQDAALTNLTACINGTTNDGTLYGQDTPVHASVTAVADTGANTMTITANVKGSAANAIATTETGTNTAWSRTTMFGGCTVNYSNVGFGPVRRIRLDLDGVHVPMVDEAGVVAYGSKKLLDFGQEAITILSARMDLAITASRPSTTEIIAAFDGDIGLGSTAAGNNNALATTEQDFCPTTPTPQASSGVTTGDAIRIAAPAILDGSATAVDLYLNCLIDDADQNIGSNAVSFLVATGRVEVCYISGGDI